MEYTIYKNGVEYQHPLAVGTLEAAAKAEGRREMALELAEWHEKQAADWRRGVMQAGTDQALHSYNGSKLAHEASAAECRRRAGET